MLSTNNNVAPGVVKSTELLIDSHLQQRAAEKNQSLQYFLYALPYVGATFLWTPTISVLNGIYAKYFGLGLAAIAFVTFVARVVDAVCDPLVGYLSDKSRAKGVGRKQWVLVGAILIIISAHYLYSPPVPAPFGYFAFWYIAFYLSWTILDIPHAAWGTEIARSYQERTTIYSFRIGLHYTGVVFFYAIPFLPIFATSEYSPYVLRTGVLIGGAILLVSVLISTWSAPEGEFIVHRTEVDGFSQLVRSVTHNKPLLILGISFFFAGIAIGMWGGLLFIFLDSYLGFGRKVASVYLISAIIGTISIPFWQLLMKRTNKVVGWACSAIVFGLLVLVYPVINPASNWLVPTSVTAMLYAVLACQQIAVLSILGDIVDYGTLKFGRDRSAVYFSFYTLMFKINLGLGGGASLAIAGYFGFDPSKATNSSMAEFGLRLAFAWIPFVLMLLSIVFIALTPINPRRHEVIRKRISALQGRCS